MYAFPQSVFSEICSRFSLSPCVSVGKRQFPRKKTQVMADIFTPGKRSEVMSKIRGRDTGPELLVRRYLFSMGLRYRVNVAGLPGKPDIVLRKFCVCVFVHGCFWHGHEGCHLATSPKSNTTFWQGKIQSNKARDARTRKELKRMGWNVIEIWECTLSSRRREKSLVSLFRKITRMDSVK
jgi:DNA mismatch endonuclease (patch repair protein)